MRKLNRSGLPIDHGRPEAAFTGHGLQLSKRPEEILPPKLDKGRYSARNCTRNRDSEITDRNSAEWWRPYR